MQAISGAKAGYNTTLMSQQDKPKTAGGNAAVASEASLADGTGEGNAPIEGTSASSDPDVLAGIEEEAGITSLNDDDYPDSIGDVPDGVRDAGEDGDLAGSKTPADRQARPRDDKTAGQATMPDEAAGVDLDDGSATPDAPGKA